MSDTTGRPGQPGGEHVGQDLHGSRFERTDLQDSTFRAVDLRGSSFEKVHLTDATVRFSELRRVVMRGVELEDVDITGELLNVTVNGVDVVPLVEAELDRRDPARPKMRPTDPDGFREAWDVVEHLWEGTVERARTLPPEQLHASVGGEWSFVETLRHLAFATDAWVGRGVLGDPAPWHPLDLPWDDMPTTPGVPCDRQARPTLDEALELRLGRMATVREVVDRIDEHGLDRMTTPVDAPGWPPPGRSFQVRDCLLVVLNEEYHHRLFAERDLAALAASSDAP
ncbi:DinB family protein [Intrasporangium flavum]|uniref:DinB family protein n=1 Tax=Intrasporangium flavum TaxID=1428657 RepID=UPI00096DFD8A|nr:DinB family protein [Intrasporangium flavum]